MQVSLIRTGSTTHAWNNDQRFMNLDFKAETWKSLNVESPQKAAYAPPGFYLLSVVDKNGVPSASKIIQLN